MRKGTVRNPRGLTPPERGVLSDAFRKDNAFASRPPPESVFKPGSPHAIPCDLLFGEKRLDCASAVESVSMGSPRVSPLTQGNECRLLRLGFLSYMHGGAWTGGALKRRWEEVVYGENWAVTQPGSSHEVRCPIRFKPATSGKGQVMGDDPMGDNNEHHRLLKCSQHWSLPGAA